MIKNGSKERIKYILLFILLIFIFEIKCANECSSCKREGNYCLHTDLDTENCNSRCRPSMTGTGCIYCHDNIAQYYKIDDNEYCQFISTCDKLIFGSQQCVNTPDECPSNYLKYGDKYCIHKNYCISAFNRKEDGSDCKCQYFYSNEIDANNRIFPFCYDNGVICNSKHRSYNSISKLCSENDCDCDETEFIEISKRGDSSNICTCKSSCDAPKKIYIKGDNKKYCSENCPDKAFYYYTEEEKTYCIEDCSNKDRYSNEKQCLILGEENCEFHFYSKCKSSCLHNENSDECTLLCKEDSFKYKDEADNICHESCEFINVNKSICITDTNTNNCFYTGSGDNKKCYSSCLESPYPYNKYQTKECIAQCGDSYPYHLKDEFTCYQLCSNNVNGDNFNIDNSICQCKFFYGFQNDGTIKCYNDEASCKGNNFVYKKGNQCLKNCVSFIHEVSGTNKLHECFDTVDDCKSNGLYYYNKDDLRCYDSLPSGARANEIDTNTNFPKEDEGRNTYTRTTECKSSFFPKFTTSGRCQKTCDNNEYFRPSSPNTCFSGGCNANEFIGDNNECLTECPYFYIEETKKCVVNCKDYYKYFFKGDKKCYDSCTKTIGSTTKYYFYNSENNECLDTCLYNPVKKYAYDNSGRVRECLTQQGKYNEDYIINKCNGYDYYPLSDTNKCIKFCINYNYTYTVNANGKLECANCGDKYIFDSDDRTRCNDGCNSNFNPAFRTEYQNECLDNCPQNYIKDNSNDCKYIICPEGQCQQNKNCINIQNYYIKENINSKEIVICKPDCNGKYIKDTYDKECVAICPKYNNYIIVLNNTCSKYCDQYIEKADTSKQPTSGVYTLYDCKGSCSLYIHEYSIDKRNCIDKCPPRFPFRTSLNGNKCYQECPNDNQQYYNLNDLKDDNYYVCTGTFPCSTEEIYCEGKCLSKNTLLSNNIYYIKDSFCVDKCLDSEYYQKNNYNDGDFIICKTTTCTNIEFNIGKECLNICPSNLNYIDSNNNCINECQNTNDHYYLLNFDALNLNYELYKCSTSCPNYNFTYTRTNDNKCYSECPRDTYNAYLSSEKKCYDNCFLSTNKFSLRIMDGTNLLVSKCRPDCNDPTYPAYTYYYEGIQVCQKKCNNNDYAVEGTNKCIRNCSSLGPDYYFFENENEAGEQKRFCVTSCRSPKPFIRGNTCVESCDPLWDEKFYVKTLETGAENPKKICLTDCPSDYPFYYETDPRYECKTSCNSGHYYVPNFGLNKNAKLCLSTCTSSGPIYKYKIEIGTNKTCYEECPSERPYHKDISKAEYSSDNNCYEGCPSGALYHEITSDLNRFICKSSLKECVNKYVDEDNKKCLRKDETCPPLKKLSKYKYNTNDYKNICSNTCSSTYGIYQTKYDTCVSDCTNDDLVQNKFLKNNNENKCICTDLFYYYEAIETCFDNQIGQKCKDMNDIHNITIYQTKECTSVCDNGRFLSLHENTCYPPSESCPTLETNTKLIEQTNGIKKCDCKDKYYFDGQNKKICLDGTCIAGYNKKYVPEIMRCMKDSDKCPSDFNHLFLDKYCLRKCPSGSTETDNSGEKICKCEEPKKFWREISISNYECLYKCFDTHPVYIASTYKCVEKCDGEYNIFYDYKCFSTCDNDEQNLNIRNGVKVPTTTNDYANYECDCNIEQSWYYEDNIKNCVTTCPGTFKYTVRSTRECVNECPLDYPYYFNEYYYSSCENEAKRDFGILVKTNAPYKECQCEYSWYYSNNDKTRKECLTQEQTCISSGIGKNYLIYRTKECVAKCPTELFELNYTCYDVCPENTVDVISEDGNYCICNLNDGFWYEQTIDGFTYKSCGLKECPSYDKNNDGKLVRMNLIESKKKCVKSCKIDGGENNEYKFAFKYMCIKSCPYLTKTNENNECLFYDLTNDDDIINNKDKFKDAANIQTNELYNKSETSYNKFGFSFEIYPINNSSMKGIALNSNKTYVDFSSCLERIYLDKNVSENDTILIAKYDLLPGENINIDKSNDKYLINPVEYELFSSSYSNEKLDALVCEPYEIVISYPIFLNKFDIYEGDINTNEIRKKFNMGKFLHNQDYTIDTFNFNSPLYKNFCRGVEIDGKDLVYEDRYKYLYPNNKLLCESNCTLNNTDFDLERVNCLCKYKEVFDFYRKEEEANDKFNDPNYFIPTQSPANAEAIKCLFKFSLKQAIIKNEGFYICALDISIEIAILFVNVVYGTHGVAGNINKSLNNLNKNNSKKNNNLNKNKNENIISTTNRPLNNPPRRSNYEEEKGGHIDNDNDNDNISSENNNDQEGMSQIEVRNENEIFKWEYIPSEYSSKFFKQYEKNLFKKIQRNKIPFTINPETKFLIEKKTGGDNYVILTDMNTSNNDVNKIVKFIKEEKLNEKDEIKNEPKTKKRINLLENIKNNDKNLINVKSIKPVQSPDSIDDMTIEDFERENEADVYSGNSSCLTVIRREQLFLRVEYEFYMKKKHPFNSYIFFAEILDKIYLVKIILFLRKYDIFCIQLSLYIFCHLLLLSLLCGFFTIKVIKKIWEEENYPDLNFYLLYGLISHIIIWIIYNIFLHLLDCSDKIKEFLLIKKGLNKEDTTWDPNDNVEEKDQKIIRKKYNLLMSQMRLRIFIFYVIMFPIIVFCTIYLISFYSIYTGTKKRVLIAYFISLFEIVLIKLIYGFCLASLRLASKVNKLKTLYNLVYVFDKYIS